MVLSKGKKIILIAVVIVIVAVAGILFYQSRQGAQYHTNQVINAMFDYLDSTQDFDYDDESTYPEFIEEFNEVRNSSIFQKELVRIVDEFSSVGIHNYDVGLDDMMETRYGDKLSYGEVESVFCNVVGLLKQTDYEDEELKGSFASFFVDSAQGARERTAENAQENDLKQGIYLDKVLQDAVTFSQAGGDFYQIPADQVATAEEISQHYDQAIQLSLEAEDRATFAEALSAASTSTNLDGQTFVEPRQILTFLVDDSAKLFTLKNENGGYYDIHTFDGTGEVTYYGDFASQVTTSGGNKYNTSELDGVWDSLSPGQRDEIIRGNQTHQNYTYYLRGEKYDGTLDTSLADEGYDYVYLNTDGSLIYLSSDSVVCKGYPIHGDFSSIYDEVEQDFQPEYPTPETEGTALTEAPYDSYTGSFREETGKWDFTVYSEFQRYNNKIYWCPREPINLRSEGSLVHSFFTVPVLVEDMTATEEYKQFTATATFADGEIHLVISEGDGELTEYHVFLDWNLTKEG